jgi:hypothetical protein
MLLHRTPFAAPLDDTPLFSNTDSSSPLPQSTLFPLALMMSGLAALSVLTTALALRATALALWTMMFVVMCGRLLTTTLATCGVASCSALRARGESTRLHPAVPSLGFLGLDAGSIFCGHLVLIRYMS